LAEDFVPTLRDKLGCVIGGERFGARGDLFPF